MKELNHDNTVNIKMNQGNISGMILIDDSFYENNLPYKYLNHFVYSIYKNDLNSDIFIGQFYKAYTEYNITGYSYICTLISKYPIHEVSPDHPMKVSKRDIRILNKKLNELKEKSQEVNG